MADDKKGKDKDDKDEKDDQAESYVVQKYVDDPLIIGGIQTSICVSQVGSPLFRETPIVRRTSTDPHLMSVSSVVVCLLNFSLHPFKFAQSHFFQVDFDGF